MDKVESQEIEGAIKEIVDQIEPDVRYLPKYGGEVLALDPGDDGKFVGGIFTYKDHVSLEFSQGASFDDPDALLEGKGKNQRHLKFRTLEDVSAKETESFLRQAIAT
ncbi:DUF1801 domain-containing protein [Roseovarius sp. M141]|uniref:DUF1801 domain-containing protein n=1 Tax=Roseovarius sp. M141 TaxID=2583806 RepID=UPI0020CF0C53|nr:DUF1801 domain-containing protein [Roseovarius sp. M141]MCQ0093872.1 DUF1801 domain-containing protein [Roseovarius sp. M141]